MCDYGYSKKQVAEDAMIGGVSWALSQLQDDPLRALLISPCGSMLDPMEVPPSVIAGIGDLAGRQEWGMFICETRCETITPGRLVMLREELPRRDIAIEVGIESSNPVVRSWCLNKGLRQDCAQSAIETVTLRRHVRAPNVRRRW